MAMAILTLSHLFTPIQALFAPRSRPLPRRAATGADESRRVCSAVRAASSTPAARVTAASCAQEPAPRPARPLRVVRVIEPHGRGTGRLRISGRMADVCAELERLAEAESRHG